MDITEDPRKGLKYQMWKEPDIILELIDISKKKTTLKRIDNGEVCEIDTDWFLKSAMFREYKENGRAGKGK